MSKWDGEKNFNNKRQRVPLQGKKLFISAAVFNYSYSFHGYLK